MNRTSRRVVAALLSGVVLSAAVVAAQSGPNVMLRQANELETVKGDLKGAIELYRKVADGADRGAAAKALLAMAECYQRLGDKEANKAYERLVRDFSDQKEAAIARARIGSSDVARSARGDRAVWTGRDVDLFGTVSPDGRYISFVDWAGTGGLMLRDLVTNTSRPLSSSDGSAAPASAEFSAISRDGSQIAFTWGHYRPQYRRELRIAPLSGNSVPTAKTIYTASGNDNIHPFDWSPDGRTLLVEVEREDRTSQLGTVSVADGSLRVLKSMNWRSTRKALFSPDGRYIAYDVDPGDGSGHSSVFIMAADASRDVAVVNDGTRNTMMGWSPDGRHVVFASDRTGAMALWVQPVEAGAAAGVAKMVKSDLSSSRSLGLTPSGTLYVWKRASAPVVKVVPIDLETGAVDHAHPVFQRFIESRGRPHWSPDGKDLLFISCGPSGGGPCTISVYSADTGTVRDVPHTLGYVQTPRLSPDRRMIVTNGRDLKGRRGVYLIDLQTKETSLLVDDDAASPPTFFEWSADGQAIIYAKGRNGGVLVERNVRSAAEKDLIRVPKECTSLPRISPDRKLLGCAVGGAADKAIALLVTPLDGGATRIALKLDAGDPSGGMWFWGPDSRSAIMPKRSDNPFGELWLYPFAGTPRRLAVDTSNWVDPHYDVDPSGRHIAFVASSGAPGDEVWALENFLPPPTPAKR
jgi:Tol biopolymer transport system component